MNIKYVCKLLALSFVDNFDSESESVSVLGFSLEHGLALVSTYYDSGVPNVSVFSFDSDSFYDLHEEDCESCSLTFVMSEVPSPLVHSYDNALKLFLLCCGEDFSSITLFGFSDMFSMFGSDFNTFNCSKLRDLLNI